MLDDYASLIADDEVWIAVEDGEVLGALVMQAAEDRLFVGNVAVRTDQQGKGLGRALIAFAEKEAKRYGLEGIRLYTNEKMYENLEVYERLRFKEPGRRLDSGYQRVSMRKRISW
jgi:GNAT superfamily N-acetyltransferase